MYCCDLSRVEEHETRTGPKQQGEQPAQQPGQGEHQVQQTEQCEH